ncbi:hypothetical protein BC831DRAFT_395368 [Entophlyctis helioformis]|nr:hypothetical protein BC831DRAFT_395368 [Entophlyctis helioformis]
MRRLTCAAWQTAFVVLDLGFETTVEALHREAAEHNGLSLIGIDTPSPVMRVGNLVYRGEPDIVVGTDLLFAVAGPAGPTAGSAGPTAGSWAISSTDGSGNSGNSRECAGAMHHIGEARRIVRFKRVEIRSCDEAQANAKAPP